MKYFLPQFCIFLLFNLSITNASIWIKNVKSYGPSAITVGVKCLSTMSKLYFTDASSSSSTKSKILVVAFTRDLSIPADNIQKSYLKWVHQAILGDEMDKYVYLIPKFILHPFRWWPLKFNFIFDSLKLELVSNAAPIKSVSHKESNIIYEKDYYVIVIDDFNKVIYM